MVIAGGTASRKLDLDAFIRQAAAYEEWEPGWDKLARVRIELGQTHAFPVKRVSELMKWVRSGEYDRIVDGEYVAPRRPARRARRGRRRRRVLRRALPGDLPRRRRRRRRRRASRSAPPPRRSATGCAPTATDERLSARGSGGVRVTPPPLTDTR